MCGRGVRPGLAKGIRTHRDFSLPFLAPGGSRGQLRTTEVFFPFLPAAFYLSYCHLSLRWVWVGESGITARSNAVNVLQQHEEMLLCMPWILGRREKLAA